MRQHAHLPAMVRFVRQHVAQHFYADRPRWRPTISAKLLDAAAAIAQRFREHLCAASGALGQSGTGLLRRTMRALELLRHLQMWSREPDPFTTHIMHMRKNRHDRPGLSGRLRSPRRRVKLLDDHLIHALICRKNLRGSSAELGLKIFLARGHDRSPYSRPMILPARRSCAKVYLPPRQDSYKLSTAKSIRIRGAS